ncbi:hypothetical protein C8F04DRAFT_382609 [Mycena alexandri]|uniref:Uncharacterized protein n=1 Tax=Mycena alexandri TaxID=1745969 RepID=A0AAD6S234_9AGAR|nr:hypothetical protein C8F04DRAFT_382609 [Mycena alexandri]
MSAVLSESKKVSTRSSGKSPRQRNYAITCEGIIIVLKTMISGSLFIITGDGKQKCIELKVDAASVGQPVIAGADRARDINVTATIRTLDIDGGPVKKEEEVEVKIEEWDEVEGKIVTSNQDAPFVATAPPAATPAAESSTQKRGSKPSASVKSKKNVEPKAPKASAPSASGSSTLTRSRASTVKAIPKSAMPPTPARTRSRVSANVVVPVPAAFPPARLSPKKRDASEMDSESDDSRKRVRVEEKPVRSSRKARASQNAS